MNTRYTEIFLFLARLSRKSNKGVALGFVLIAGVLMAGGAAMMLLRSSSEKEKVVAQEASAKGKTTGEVAIARMQYLLGQYPFLAQLPFDDWQSADVEAQIETQINNSCDGQSLTQTQIDAKVGKIKEEIAKYIKKDGEDYEWLAMDASKSSKGQFRFKAFEPAIAGQEMGTLTIEARANVGNDFNLMSKRIPHRLTLGRNFRPTNKLRSIHISETYAMIVSSFDKDYA